MVCCKKVDSLVGVMVMGHRKARGSCMVFFLRFIMYSLFLLLVLCSQSFILGRD